MSRTMALALTALAALSATALYLDFRATVLERQRDQARAEAAFLQQSVDGHAAALSALAERAAQADGLLVELARHKQALEDEYDRKSQLSEQARLADPDFAAWSAAPLPARLRAGNGLLGKSADADSAGPDCAGAAGRSAGTHALSGLDRQDQR